MNWLKTITTNRFVTLLLGVPLLLASVTFPANAVTATAQTPDELVRQLYKSDSAIVSRGTLDDDKRVPHYFDKALGNLILADHHAEESDQISFDPILDTNGGIEMNDLRIGAPKYTGDNATVLVTFTLKELTQKKKITYSLHKTAQGWRISDLATDEWGLKATLRHLHPTSR